MSRGIIAYLLFWLLLTPFTGLSQLPSSSAIPGYSYHPMREDKASWQRLSLLMGATFLVVAKEGQVDLDSCLHAASRSMGISRFTLLAEGIDDPELAAQSKWIDRYEPAQGVSLLSETSGKRHAQLLLLLGAYYAFQPHNYYKHKDSVEYFLTRAIQESKSLKEDKLGRLALCLLVKVYALGNDEKADSVCQTLIVQCRQAGDKETAARALAYRSKFTPPLASTLKRKIDDAQQAAALYHSVGNVEGEVNALTDLGYLQMIIGQKQTAYENHLKAFELAEAIHYPYTHYNTQALVTVTLFQGKFGEPLRYTYQLIRTAEETRDSLAWGYFYTNLAQLYGWEGRTKESIEWSRKSVNRFVAERNTSVYRMLDNVVLYMQENGQAREALDLALDISNKVGYPTTFSDQFSYHTVFSDCYIGLHQPDQAEVHINKLDKLETKAETVRGPMRRSEVDGQYAYLLMERKQYRKAREFLNKRFVSPGLMDSYLAPNLQAYRQLIFIDSILGDNTAAVAHYRRYTQLRDSGFQISKLRQAEELQVIYQMKEKENEISSLTQQTKLEKANSEKAALVRDLTIAGIFAALIIAALLYRQSRLRKKNNEVIVAKNEQLQQLLADKEWLLKEIHHRVKNNLQIIMSLLDSQSEYINNDAALAAIEDNMRRVHAMALIHQKLYQSEDIATIAMPGYINELVNYARESFDTNNRIVFEQKIEPLNLDVSQTVPLGLIINESIVNAIKYAFPHGRKGVVRIHFYRDGTRHLVLKIADNGTGLPPGFDTKAHTSLGFDLMQGLTKQLNGSFLFESNNGLHITIRFMEFNSHYSPKTLINL
ncbi:sensor histidine kinase [Chitinophaga filiformis]|uniref:histidine kinase n=1 Tax=Chitinophaga filiformis TaxID=104663 RepID=A0A1G7Y623_CHIFI|nr:sensor histidine kinase [Chitinophaga filiformis]SDG91817.1 Two-component sensor histidine kinase, contains HisKA and HATPase domains [Chitinophaga filiformis]